MPDPGHAAHSRLRRREKHALRSPNTRHLTSLSLEVHVPVAPPLRVDSLDTATAAALKLAPPVLGQDVADRGEHANLSENDSAQESEASGLRDASQLPASRSDANSEIS